MLDPALPDLHAQARAQLLRSATADAARLEAQLAALPSWEIIRAAPSTHYEASDQREQLERDLPEAQRRRDLLGLSKAALRALVARTPLPKEEEAGASREWTSTWPRWTDAQWRAQQAGQVLKEILEAEFNARLDRPGAPSPKVYCQCCGKLEATEDIYDKDGERVLAVTCTDCVEHVARKRHQGKWLDSRECKHCHKWFRLRDGPAPVPCCSPGCAEQSTEDLEAPPFSDAPWDAIIVVPHPGDDVDRRSALLGLYEGNPRGLDLVLYAQQVEQAQRQGKVLGITGKEAVRLLREGMGAPQSPRVIGSGATPQQALPEAVRDPEGAAILRVLAQHPDGLATEALVAASGLQAAVARAAIKRLVETGQIVAIRGGRGGRQVTYRLAPETPA